MKRHLTLLSMLILPLSLAAEEFVNVGGFQVPATRFDTGLKITRIVVANQAERLALTTDDVGYATVVYQQDTDMHYRPVNTAALDDPDGWQQALGGGPFLFQFRQQSQAALDAIVLLEGEPGVTTDTGRLYMGLVHPDEEAFTISGSGTSSVNGVWVEDGTSAGKPSYAHIDGGLILLWDTSDWVISNPGLFETYYSSDEDVAEPWLVETWVLSFEGSAPTPETHTTVNTRMARYDDVIKLDQDHVWTGLNKYQETNPAISGITRLWVSSPDGSNDFLIQADDDADTAGFSVATNSGGSEGAFFFPEDELLGAGRILATREWVEDAPLSEISWDDDSTAGNTRFLLYDVDTSSLQRVKVGANDSGPGGSGRALYIDNSP